MNGTTKGSGGSNDNACAWASCPRYFGWLC